MRRMATSIMPGSLNGLFDDLNTQTKRAYCRDGVRLGTNEPLFLGIGLSLTPSCFLGLKAVDREALERAIRQGNSTTLFSL